MALASPTVLQFGFPEYLPDLLGLAGTLVLVLILAALGGFLYRHLTGGVEWPEDREDDDDTVRKGGADDEWDYY